MRTLRTPRFRRAAARATLLSVTAAVIALAALACGGSSKDATPTTAPPPSAASTIADPPGAADRAMISGTMTLDGAPMVAQFLGARVIRDGLSTACQFAIPDVTSGRYAVEIVADAEVRGCGAPGAQIVLWVFTKGMFIYSDRTTPWPGNGATATFDASFSSSAPAGATKPVTEFKGRVFDRGGRQPGGGIVVQAYVGDGLCGVTSTRYGSDVDHFYTLIVAGPQAITACAQGATLTFRIDGKPVPETAVNDLGQGSQGHELNFTVQ